MPYLLDTSVAVALLDGVQPIMSRVSQIDGQFLSVISWVELEAGVYRESSGQVGRRTRLDDLLAHVEVFNFGPLEVAAYSSVIATLGFSRRLIVDRMIAATALANDVALATLNPRDFRGIAGLRVEDWS